MQKQFVVYKSSAGSGKTYTLVKEYLKLALADTSPVPKAYRKILAITFTNKAAAEMKLRVIEALKQIASDHPKAQTLINDISKDLKLDASILQTRAIKLLSEILHNYSDFAISTIDSFTHKIVKTFAYDLKLPVNFTIETNTNEFYHKVVSGLMAKIGENKELTELLVQYSANNAQENNSWDPELKLIEFTELIQKEDAAINLGKLKNYNKEQLKLIQKNLRAFVTEFKNTLQASGIEGVALIKKQHLNDTNFTYGKNGPQSCFYKWAGFNKENPEDTIGKRLDDAISKNKWHNNKNSESENVALDAIIPQLNKIASETINYINSYKQQYNLYNLLEKNIYALILLNELQQISEEFRAEENIVFISEFNSKISEIVANEPSPFIYERLGERYDHFLLDEFQDTSTLQWLNLLPLIDNALSKDQFNLIVGDGKQSIYRWRNANVLQFNALPHVQDADKNPVIAEREAALLRNFEGKVLDTNYRSLKEIVDFNNSVFEYLPKELLSDQFKSIYDSQHQHTKFSDGGYVSVHYGEAESELIDEINFKLINTHITQALQSGFLHSDICVITRNNKDGNAIANYLIENNIPVISSDSLLLKNSTEVNCIVSFLKYLNNPFDQISAATVVNFIASKQSNLPALLAQLSSTKNLFTVLNSISIPLSPHSFTQKNVFDSCVEIITHLKLEQKNPQYIRFFLDEVNDYLVNKTGSINDFLYWWEKRKEQASLIIPDGTNAVKIMTIHKSKGLEFPVVILPFVNWQIYKANNAWVDLENLNTGLPVGVLKISSGIAEAGLETVFELEKNEQYLDNLNLLYVAFTRAAERLHVISYKSKNQKQENISIWIKKYIDAIRPNDNTGLAEFGSLAPKTSGAHKQQAAAFNISEMRFNDNKGLIKIKGSHQLKLSEESTLALANGIKMHYILSEIHLASDVELVLDTMIKKGIIASEEKAELHKKIAEILKDKLIEAYYTGDLLSKNEAEIITDTGELLRPDKIILNNSSAVVIDYKTGQTDSKKYAKQMQKYSDALMKMGYTSIKKILVYLDENKVEELH